MKKLMCCGLILTVLSSVGTVCFAGRDEYDAACETYAKHIEVFKDAVDKAEFLAARTAAFEICKAASAAICEAYSASTLNAAKYASEIALNAADEHVTFAYWLSLANQGNIDCANTLAQYREDGYDIDNAIADTVSDIDKFYQALEAMRMAQ